MLLPLLLSKLTDYDAITKTPQGCFMLGEKMCHICSQLRGSHCVILTYEYSLAVGNCVWSNVNVNYIAQKRKTSIALTVRVIG